MATTELTLYIDGFIEAVKKNINQPEDAEVEEYYYPLESVTIPFTLSKSNSIVTRREFFPLSSYIMLQTLNTRVHKAASLCGINAQCRVNTKSFMNVLVNRFMSIYQNTNKVHQKHPFLACFAAESLVGTVNDILEYS